MFTCTNSIFTKRRTDNTVCFIKYVQMRTYTGGYKLQNQTYRADCAMRPLIKIINKLNYHIPNSYTLILQ